MTIIGDANIIFSGILNANGKIGDLLLNSPDRFLFIAPEFLRTEIYSHHDKLMKISKLSIKQLLEAEYQLYKSIEFISEEQIEPRHWKLAADLVSDIDPKDAVYIAFTKQFNCKLWTGDKQMHKGLLKKGFKDILTTRELFNLRNKTK
ncbi:PIN domain-containing protein [uncultured Proteiniphilum sp.]|uniref:PIN domain-containing protein n=1 Tax=uncultured Proteiniphilum sp. TaxID=497637 RepID=UPI0026248780|nr:PIN domain-containing protein [uncultured Proteiniphilum sp.]